MVYTPNYTKYKFKVKKYSLKRQRTKHIIYAVLLIGLALLYFWVDGQSLVTNP